MDGAPETQVADKHCFAAAFADERVPPRAPG